MSDTNGKLIDFPEPEQPPVIERVVEVTDKYELKVLMLKIENFNLKVLQIQYQVTADEARLAQERKNLEAVFQEKYEMSLEDAMKGLDS